jgi:hypothetical protein
MQYNKFQASTWHRYVEARFNEDVDESVSKKTYWPTSSKLFYIPYDIYIMNCFAYFISDNESCEFKYVHV